MNSAIKSTLIKRFTSYFTRPVKTQHNVSSFLFETTKRLKIDQSLFNISRSVMTTKTSLRKFNGSSWRSKDVISLDDIYRHLVQDDAQDITVLELDPKVNYVKYFIVVSANSKRHLEHMSESLNILYKRSKKKSDPFSKIEGKRFSVSWHSLDLGNSVVHFMMEENRKKYELEKLWLLGPKFDSQTQGYSDLNDANSLDDWDAYISENVDESVSGVDFVEDTNNETSFDESDYIIVH